MTAAQLALFEAPPTADDEPLRPDFWSHSNPDRSGIAAFVVAIWGKGDPERSPRDGSDMAVLRRVLSLGWGHDAPADIGESVAAIVKAYLRFVGSSPSIKAGLS